LPLVLLRRGALPRRPPPACFSSRAWGVGGRSSTRQTTTRVWPTSQLASPLQVPRRVGGRRRGALARCGREAERCAREQARGRRRGARASKQENACHRKRDELCRSARETADEGRRRVGHGRGSAECRVNTVDAGVFCNGEIGPVHGSSRLLGFTSVFTLLRQKTAAPAAETSG